MNLDQLIQMAFDQHLIDEFEDLPFHDHANEEILDQSALIDWLVDALGLFRCACCCKVLRDATSSEDICYSCGLEIHQEA